MPGFPWSTYIEFFNNFDAETISEAVVLGKKAVALDPNDSQCHAQLGFELSVCPEIRTGRTYRPNVQLKSIRTDGVAVNSRAQWLSERDKRKKRCEFSMRRFAAIPYPPSWYWENLAVALITLGRFEEAIAAINRKSRNFWWDHYMLGVCYTYLGRTSQAQAEMAELRRLRPERDDQTHNDGRAIQEHGRCAAPDRRLAQGWTAGMSAARGLAAGRSVCLLLTLSRLPMSNPLQA